MLTGRGPVASPYLRRAPLPAPGWHHLVRLAAFAAYTFAVLAAFAILAPVVPAAYQDFAYSLRAVVPGVYAPPPEETAALPAETRTVKVKRAQSVDLVALRNGTSSFELYALNAERLRGPLVEPGTRLRLPR